MDINFKLISFPINIHQWNVVKEGFNKIVSSNTGDETLKDILGLLNDRKIFLWIVELNNEYIGFFTTKKVDDCLIIPHGYKKPGKRDKEFNKRILEHLESHAKLFSCKKIKLFTTRDSDKYWGSVGFTRGYTEYVKEIPGE